MLHTSTFVQKVPEAGNTRGSTRFFNYKTAKTNSSSSPRLIIFFREIRHPEPLLNTLFFLSAFNFKDYVEEEYLLLDNIYIWVDTLHMRSLTFHIIFRCPRGIVSIVNWG